MPFCPPDRAGRKGYDTSEITFIIQKPKAQSLKPKTSLSLKLKTFFRSLQFFLIDLI
jgi:hypothetical protein